MLKVIIKLVAALVFISLLLWFFVFSSLFSDIQLAKSTLKQETEEYTAKKKSVEEIRKLQSRYKQLDEEVKQVNEMLPSTVKYPKLLVEIPALIRASGMAYNKLDFGSPDQQGGGGDSGDSVKKHEIKVSLSGGYRAFKNNFLYLQQKDLRLMDINRVKIAPGEGGRFEFSLVLQTYFQP